MNRAASRLSILALPLLLTVPLYLRTSAANSARPAARSLPTLRLDYFNTTGRLANSLDPALTSLAAVADTIALVNANLVHVLPSGKVAPDLATWKVSRNHLVYTFSIHRNARFSNGHSVTAADAAFSLKRSLSPTTGGPGGEPIPPVALSYDNLIEGALTYHSGTTKTLAGVKVLSTRVLQITITKPAAYFLAALSYPTADVLDPAIVGDKPAVFKNNYLTNTCVGNQGAGPFTFVCKDRSSQLRSFYSGSTPTYTLVPNPYYYGRKAHIRIELPSYKESYKHYLAGTVDDTINIPSVYLKRWNGKSNQYHDYPSSIVLYLTPNTHIAPFNNVHCRLAVAYAIDRETIANKILNGAFHATYDMVARGMLGYSDGKDNPHYGLGKARAEVARCPSRTVPVELVYPVSGIVRSLTNAFILIDGALRAVGMNVKLKGVSLDAWAAIVGQPLDKTNTQLVQNAWQQDYPDPQDYCSLLLHSGTDLNVGGWRNTTYDRLVDRADITQNRKERARLYLQAQHLALSQGAFISMVNNATQALIKPYVHGLTGSEAYADLVPNGYDWSKVSVGKH